MITRSQNIYIYNISYLGASHHVLVHHQDGNLPVHRPLDLLPHYRVHLHNLIRQPVEVQEGAHLAAERAGLVLVQGQLRTSTWSLGPDPEPGPGNGGLFFGKEIRADEIRWMNNHVVGGMVGSMVALRAQITATQEKHPKKQMCYKFRKLFFSICLN